MGEGEFGVMNYMYPRGETKTRLVTTDSDGTVGKRGKEIRVDTADVPEYINLSVFLVFPTS
jgi:hypothetical protein